MGVRHMQGTPAHIETLHSHSNDKRRHQSRCKYYVSDTGRCSYQVMKCDGSAHCNYYAENNEPTSLTFTKKNNKSVTISKGSRITYNGKGEGIVKNIRSIGDMNDGYIADIQFQNNKENLVAIKIPEAIENGNLTIKHPVSIKSKAKPINSRTKPIKPKTKVKINSSDNLERSSSTSETKININTFGYNPKWKIVRTVENREKKNKKR